MKIFTPRKSIILAKVMKGRYKDSQIEVEFGDGPHNTHVMMNGKEVRRVTGIHIHCRAGRDPNTLVLELWAGRD